MNFVLNLFKKRNFKLLLYGGGVLFNYRNQQYYIDSENYSRFFNTEIIINRNNIRKVINGNYLNENVENEIQIEEKKIILRFLISELKAFGYIVTSTVT